MIPIVSIITPCYNSSLFISNTIESVLSQSYSNWEMLIIDDCSTDNSADIINGFAEKDHRIRYFRTDKPSGSPSLPRNIGIENAKGKYIAFLDSDDIWLPDKLEYQVKYMSDNNYQFVYSDYEKIDENGERNNRIILMPPKSAFWDVIETCTIPCLTVMMAKEIIGNTKFKYIPKEDFAFWLDILKKGVIAHNVGKVLALYRESHKSRSANKFDMIKNQWTILRKVEGVKPIVATYFMVQYILNGLLKFVK